MSGQRGIGRIGLAVLCFLLGVLIGGGAIYLLDHRAAFRQPLYLGTFAVVALCTLGVADRLVTHRAPPPNDPDRPGDRRRSG
ncbi:hypothetical protein ACFWXO_16135 [Kitasatospora sp. NPDC059088]|uniref:hypothetical protein n=1 Tax=Kitasatospora sp. NPDC059088 TaxID=3346722 RepID=UPI00368254E5